MTVEEAIKLSPKIRMVGWGDPNDYIIHDPIKKHFKNNRGEIIFSSFILNLAQWEPYYEEEKNMTKDEFFKRFEQKLANITSIMKAKNHDYSGDQDPLANLKLCAQAGISPWKGVVSVRMADKYSRLQTYCKTENYKVKDEGFKDTLVDMAVYSLLALLLFEEEERL